jgi:hypothetical protein
MKEFDDLIRQKGLPRVGQTVRSKDFGTIWRIMSKTEKWQNGSDDPETGEPRMVPAIQLTYWKVQEGVMPGVGRMMTHSYTLYDNTFEVHWEIMP